MLRGGFVPAVMAVAGGGLIFFQSALGQAAGNAFAFGDYLVAPVRVHLLAAKQCDAIQTTLLETDITRILGKVNGVWAQAGLHFYLESVVREEASHQESYRVAARGEDHSQLPELRPPGSRTTNMFHIYYLKEMGVNGIFFPDGMFVKDTAWLRPVADGLDEPLPRVTSHELGLKQASQMSLPAGRTLSLEFRHEISGPCSTTALLTRCWAAAPSFSRRKGF